MVTILNILIGNTSNTLYDSTSFSYGNDWGVERVKECAWKSLGGVGTRSIICIVYNLCIIYVPYIRPIAIKNWNPLTKIKKLPNHLTTKVILVYLQMELIMAQNILNSVLTLCTRILLYFEARNVRRDTARCAEKFTRKFQFPKKLTSCRLSSLLLRINFTNVSSNLLYCVHTECGLLSIKGNYCRPFWVRRLLYRLAERPLERKYT